MHKKDIKHSNECENFQEKDGKQSSSTQHCEVCTERHDGHCHDEKVHCHEHNHGEQGCKGHSHSHGEHEHCHGEHSHCHDEHCELGHSHSHSCACCDDTPIKIDKTQSVWQIDKKEVVLVVLSAILLIVAFCMEHFGGEKLFWGYLPIYIIAYLLVALDSMAEGFRGLLHKDIFNENTLMNVASIGAFCIGEFEEGVAVMLLYTVGEIIQGISVRKSKKSIGQLLDIKVDKSVKILDDGSSVQVDTSSLAIGDKVLVKAGEKVPVDGIITEGSSSFDYSKLTGESIPVELKENDELLGGTVNLESSIVLKVTREDKDTTVSKILRLVEEAQKSKPKAEKFVRKFAKIYTPVVFFIALCIAVFAPMIKAFDMSYTESVTKGLVFLVISCPCALVISTPLTYFGGIGSASRKGVLVKGGNYLEMLNSVEEVCFDKTGTITEGKLQVEDIVSDDVKLLKEVAGACENLSNHPIARCISEYCGIKERASDSKEVAGKGMICEYKGKTALLGNKKLMSDYGIDIGGNESLQALSIVYVAYDGKYLGAIALADKIREGVKESIADLKSRGMKPVMLTGDNERVAKEVAAQVGIDDYKAGLLPQDKCDYVQNGVASGKKVMFVGDGLNDAPAIKNATIGVCIGGMGNDASVEASDVVLVGGKLNQLDDAFKVAKKTRRIIIQNIAMALGVKFAIMVICMFVTPIMWLAVIADVGVCLLAVFNSMRTLKTSDSKRAKKLGNRT